MLVLGVFAWLVSRHGNKLFSPGDFKDEANYIRALTASASLAAATVANGQELSQDQLSAVVESVHEVGATSSQDRRGPAWRNQVLWVDDRPGNNIYERNAFEAMGIKFTLALSTNDALALLQTQQFGAIISDMGRREGVREGYVLLERLRESGNTTPFFIYAGSDAPEHRREAAERGAQGSTNDPEELFRNVTSTLLRG